MIKIGMISCGEELLFGKTLDENKLNLGAFLTERAYQLSRQVTIGDDMQELRDAFDFLSDMDIICVTGGLGETHDDITREGTEDYFPDYQVHQITNHNGTAAGYHYSKGDHHVILMPGPPHENKPMFKEIEKLLPVRDFYPKRLNLSGISELDVEKRVKHLIDEKDFATYVGVSNTALRINDLSKVDAVKEALADYIYSEDEVSLEEAIFSDLKAQGLRLATAESVTSGLIAYKMTSLSGSSDVYYGGVNVYQDEAKRTLLGVEQEHLEEFTSVSEEITLKLSQRLYELTGADICLSITGYAEHEDPMLHGLCHVAIYGPWGQRSFSKQWRYGRDKNREVMSVFALVNLRKLLLNYVRSSV